MSMATIGRTFMKRLSRVGLGGGERKRNLRAIHGWFRERTLELLQFMGKGVKWIAAFRGR